MEQVALHVQRDGADWAASSETIPDMRTLLFVGPSNLMSGAMAAAIEKEFPCLRVERAASLRAALDEFEIPLRLLLVDLHLANELSSLGGEVLRRHPTSAFAIVTDSDLRGSAERFHAIDTRIVRGVLPMNVSLDVLLSMLRIILRGGTYFASIVYSNQENLSAQTNGVDLLAEPKAQLAKTDHGKTIQQLTKRENEILARIALGNQNKIIAAALGLSEHTVKIHIHNIITKLGVHNRTEAVALYFDHKNKNVGDAPLEAPIGSEGGAAQCDNG